MGKVIYAKYKAEDMKEKFTQLLINEALDVRKMAYAPYSNFLVGAALIVPSGKIYTGCNLENASYGLSICAERNAVFSAVRDGQRHIDAIAIVGGPLTEVDSDETSIYAYPCGACRQVLSEFLPETGEMEVIVAKSITDYKVIKLSELLPYSFKL